MYACYQWRSRCSIKCLSLGKKVIKKERQREKRIIRRLSTGGSEREREREEREHARGKPTYLTLDTMGVVEDIKKEVFTVRCCCLLLICHKRNK